MTAGIKLTRQLCLECGMCCNGVLFKDVELQPGDVAPKLRALGLPIKDAPPRGRPIPRPDGVPVTGKQRFPQPCAALCAGNRCRLYADRPARCREFECAVLKAAAAGRIEVPQALRLIRTAQRRVESVLRLLRKVGDRDEHLPLRRRFRQTQRRLESTSPDQAVGNLFSQLTVAFHHLNLLLAEEFHPGRTDETKTAGGKVGR